MLTTSSPKFRLNRQCTDSSNLCFLSRCTTPTRFLVTATVTQVQIKLHLERRSRMWSDSSFISFLCTNIITDGGCEFDPAAPMFHQEEEQDSEPQVRNQQESWGFILKIKDSSFLWLGHCKTDWSTSDLKFRDGSSLCKTALKWATAWAGRLTSGCLMATFPHFGLVFHLPVACCIPTYHSCLRI